MTSKLEFAKKRAEELISTAISAREHAYAPYSGFKVGAAVLAGSGKTYGGCNVENASYSLTICAERVAIGNAILSGEKEIEAIAVVADASEPVTPCGACLQVLAEFFTPDDPIAIIAAKLDGSYGIRSLSEYLPIQFRFQPGGSK